MYVGLPEELAHLESNALQCVDCASVLTIAHLCRPPSHTVSLAQLAAGVQFTTPQQPCHPPHTHTLSSTPHRECTYPHHPRPFPLTPPHTHTHTHTHTNTHTHTHTHT